MAGMMANLGASGPAPDEGEGGEPAGGLELEGEEARVAVSSSGRRVRFVAGARAGAAVGGGAAGGQTGSLRRSPEGAQEKAPGTTARGPGQAPGRQAGRQPG